MPSNLPTYLGDGVYLDPDRGQLWLAVGDHRNRVVALEPDAFWKLIAGGSAYLAGLYNDPEGAAMMLERFAREIRKAAPTGGTDA